MGRMVAAAAAGRGLVGAALGTALLAPVYAASCKVLANQAASRIGSRARLVQPNRLENDAVDLYFCHPPQGRPLRGIGAGTAAIS